MAELRSLVGKNIRSKRLKLHLTQAELSARVGVSLRYLREIEHGRANVRLAVIEQLALALGTTAADLATQRQSDN